MVIYRALLLGLAGGRADGRTRIFTTLQRALKMNETFEWKNCKKAALQRLAKQEAAV